MKIVIAGGRDFKDYSLFCVTCDDIIQRYLKLKYEEVEIVSGGAKGADRMAENYAKNKRYKFTKFPADWKKHGKAAGPIRNSEMREYGDYLIAFWDGESKGTKDIATKFGFPNEGKYLVQYYNQVPTIYKDNYIKP